MSTTPPPSPPNPPQNPAPVAPAPVDPFYCRWPKAIWAFLKKTADTWKVLAVLFPVACFIPILLFGVEKGPIFTGLLIGFSCAIGLLIGAFGYYWDASREAEVSLDASKQKLVEERRATVKKLRIARWFMAVLVAILAIWGSVFPSWELTPVAHRYFKEDTPKEMEFENLHYFDSTADAWMKNDAPFLESVRVRLEKEGENEGLNTRSFSGFTKPLPHPTPAFEVGMKFDSDSYEVTLYAFRKHKDESRTIFEAARVGYHKGDLPIIVAFPKAEAGDQLFIVGRFSLKKGTTDFPKKPDITLKPRPVEKEK